MCSLSAAIGARCIPIGAIYIVEMEDFNPSSDRLSGILLRFSPENKHSDCSGATIRAIRKEKFYKVPESQGHLGTASKGKVGACSAQKIGASVEAGCWHPKRAGLALPKGAWRR